MEARRQKADFDVRLISAFAASATNGLASHIAELRLGDADRGVRVLIPYCGAPKVMSKTRQCHRSRRYTKINRSIKIIVDFNFSCCANLPSRSSIYACLAANLTIAYATR